MNNHVATAMALALVVGLGGLAAVPSVAAVSPDCGDEYTIQDSEPVVSRTLLGQGQETGVEDVTATGGDENVTLRLDTNNDELEFGVFVIDPDTQKCVAASSLGLSDCGSAEVLDTTGPEDEDEIVCRLKAPDSGGINYFFHAVNLQNDSLGYSPWMSD